MSDHSTRRSVLRAAGAGLVLAPFGALGASEAFAAPTSSDELKKLKALRATGAINDPRTNRATVSQTTRSLADTTSASVTAAKFLASCAADIGKVGDDYVWLELARRTGNKTLESWAKQDAPYCAGGMQLNRWRLGLGGYPAPLPYYVPSLRDHAQAHGQWVSAANARPGDLVVLFRAGHVGVLEKKNADATITTIEYNTSSSNSGSQTNGRGCYRRVRSLDNVTGFIRHHAFGDATGPTPVVEPLVLGSKGERVTNLQKSLNAWFPAYESVPVSVDGSYGPRTEAAVKEFQSRARIEVDGRFGPATRKAFHDATNVWI